MSSPNLAVTRPKNHALEQRFEALTNKHSTVASSVTSAQVCGLRSWMGSHKIQIGSEVIVSGLTLGSIGLDLMLLGLVPVFCDVDPDTLQPTIKTISAAKTERTAGVFVTHYGGYPAPIDEISDWCKVRRLFLMDDASQCLPTVYKKWSNGSWPSDMTVFDLHVGGVVCFSEELLSKEAKKWRLSEIWEPPATPEDQVRGYKAYMSEGRAKEVLDDLDDIQALYEARSKVWGMYAKAFLSLDTVSVPWDDSKQVKQSCQQYSLRVDGSRTQVVDALTRNGITVPRQRIPIYRMSIWASAIPSLPVLEEILLNEVLLPVSEIVSYSQVRRVIDAVRKSA